MRLQWTWVVPLLLMASSAGGKVNKSTCQKKSQQKCAAGKVPKRLLSSERHPSCLVVNKCSETDRGLPQTKLPNLIPLIDIQDANVIISDASKGIYFVK